MSLNPEGHPSGKQPQQVPRAKESLYPSSRTQKSPRSPRAGPVDVLVLVGLGKGEWGACSPRRRGDGRSLGSLLKGSDCRWLEVGTAGTCAAVVHGSAKWQPQAGGPAPVTTRKGSFLLPTDSCPLCAHRVEEGLGGLFLLLQGH